MKFDKDPLTVEQNNYTNNIVNIIFYDLDAWPGNPTVSNLRTAYLKQLV